jgi:hypothetical protein
VHSFELQVLGETGVLGGVFAFGGILVAAGRILWPRSAAGWRMVQRSRARRRERPVTGGESVVSDPGMDNSPHDLPGGSSSRYGWHMALLAACAYWLVHASIDWPWRMSGVTLPILLLLAAGLGSLDTSANPLRLRPWRSRRIAQTGVAGLSRSSWLRSSVFRGSLLTLSLLVFVFACFPFISSLYQDSALALADRDPADAAERAVSVHWLVPGDPGPFETQAYIYSAAAERALVSDSPDRAGAVLDALALRLGSCERAMNLEPVDWSSHRAAGVAALDLYLARGYVEGWSLTSVPDVVAASPTGAHDWSGLSALRQYDPGDARDSPAQSDKARAEAERYRGLSREELARMALTYLSAAKQLNPLAKQTDMDLQVLAEVAPATAAGER